MAYLPLPRPLQPAASCEVVAFSLGGLTSMPALRNFSACAALAVLLDFLLQVTAFVALLALDTRRLEQGRFDCWPWRRWVGECMGWWGLGWQRAGTRAEARDEAGEGGIGFCAPELTCCAAFVHTSTHAHHFPSCRARGAPLYDSDFEEMYGGSAGAPLLGGSEGYGVDEAREEVEATFGHAFHAEQPGVRDRARC